MATAKKLPSGNWRVQVYAGKDATGKPQYRSFTACTKKEAEYTALQWQLHYRDVFRDSACMTLSEAMGQYIRNRDGTLSPSTIRGYETILHHRLPGLMGKQLKALTPAMIQDALNEEAREHTPKTVRNVYGLLTSTLKAYHPILARQLQENPPTLPQRIPHEQTVLEPEQLSILLRAVQGDPIEIPVLLAVWLTLRQSEVLGLTWDNVDFERHTLRVCQARVRDQNQKLVVKTTKTTASNRTLRVPSYIEERLRSAREEADGEFVVNMTGNSIYSRLKTILKHNGLPDIRYHDLRHCCASVMVAENLPLYYIQRRGGWASDRTLKSVYTHLLDSKRGEVDNVVDAFFDSLISK